MRWIALFGLGQAARALVLHVVGEVLVLVVVGAIGRDDAGSLAARGAGASGPSTGQVTFFALDEFFAQHVGVVLGRQLHGLSHAECRALGHADGRTFARRL